ncbi:MAG: GNAT family N-acetyltransferase [Verrucomicrobiota bacterium]
MRSDTVVSFRQASMEDLTGLFPIIREFYQYFGFVWDDDAKKALLRRIIGDPKLGRIWLAESEAGFAGYALVAFYFSLEFDGLAALLDELYVSPRYRGRGVGEQLLTETSRALVDQGARVLRLEVDRRYPSAAKLYARLGFVPDGRETWTKRLPSPPFFTARPTSK